MIHLDLSKIVILLVLGIFILGPERLPGMVEQAAQTLRALRVWLKENTEELRAELGPEMAELDLRSLHPREFVRKYLLEDPDDVDAEPGGGRRVLHAGEPAPWDPDTT